MSQPDLALGRRQLLQILGLAGATPASPPELLAWLQHVHQVAAQAPPSAGRRGARRYRPLLDGGRRRFFSAAEFRALSALVDQILPATDTPGALAVGVPWYLDTVVEAEPELRPQFRQGLALLETLAREQAGRRFAQAAPDQQVKVIESMVPTSARGNAFFETVKAMTIVAYYSSEIGLYQELKWVESVIKTEFQGGCTHTEHAIKSVNAIQQATSRALSAPEPFAVGKGFVGEAT